MVSKTDREIKLGQFLEKNYPNFLKRYESEYLSNKDLKDEYRSLEWFVRGHGGYVIEFHYLYENEFDIFHRDIEVLHYLPPFIRNPILKELKALGIVTYYDYPSQQIWYTKPKEEDLS